MTLPAGADLKGATVAVEAGDGVVEITQMNNVVMLKK